MKTINPILNTFITGDCEQVLKEIPSDSIDFVLTSPPYADKRDYGNENSSISPDEYVEWFLPKGREIYRVLKPTGSFIIETKKPEKSRQKAAGCRNTQEVIYTQPLFITPFYLLKGYRSDRLDINIPVIPKAARRDGFTR